MNERNNAVALHGNPLTLADSEMGMGDPIPGVVALINNDMQPVKLSDSL